MGASIFTQLPAFLAASGSGTAGAGAAAGGGLGAEGIASILSGIFGGAAGALGGGDSGGVSKRQIDEKTQLQRQGQNNQALAQLAQILLRNSGRGGF